MCPVSNIHNLLSFIINSTKSLYPLLPLFTALMCGYIILNQNGIHFRFHFQLLETKTGEPNYWKLNWKFFHFSLHWIWCSETLTDFSFTFMPIQLLINYFPCPDQNCFRLSSLAWSHVNYNWNEKRNDFSNINWQT